MIFGVILNADEKETYYMYEQFRELTAHHTDEKLQFESCREGSQLLEKLKAMDILDIAVIDVTLPGGIEAARNIRKIFPKTEILIIADISVSPVNYLCPSIRASALLLRPMSSGWDEAVREFFLLFMISQKNTDDHETLRVENRRGIFRVPFEKIYYLEAKEKKVFVRTQIEEISVSETLEKMAEKMPSNFARCHRSFIVNMDLIMQVNMHENMLNLKDGMIVPFSRSYRKLFKRGENG